MHPKCLNLGALCVKLTKNHPNGRKNNRLSNFRKLRIITFEAFRWLYMTSYGAFRLLSLCIGRRLPMLAFCVATNVTRTNIRNAQSCCERLASADVERCSAMKSEWTINPINLWLICSLTLKKFKIPLNWQEIDNFSQRRPISKPFRGK